MSLRLTPERLAAAYDFLRAFPPFDRWRLPPGDEVRFHVAYVDNWYGHYSRLRRSHRIDISAVTVGHGDTLLRTMAHEMVHVRQNLLNKSTVHNAEFRRLGGVICSRFGWDPKAF